MPSRFSPRALVLRTAYSELKRQALEQGPLLALLETTPHARAVELLRGL